MAADGTEQNKANTSLFALLCLINLLNYIDRAAVTGLLEPIRRDLGGTDAQLGLVGLAFLLTYTILPPVFGWLGDRYARTRIISGSVAFWSIATAGTGLVRGIGALAALRAAVGVGEASYMANSPSLILDLVTPPKRGRAMSLFYTASPAGAALGVALGGALWPHYGWRGACAIVGLPGLLAAALIWRSREPRRGQHDPDAAALVRRGIGSTLAYLGRNRLYVLLVLAYGGVCFTQNAIEFWLPTVLQRDKHVPITEANATYGAVVLAAGLLGPLIGAACADRLRRTNARAYFYVAALAALLVTIPLAGLLASTSRVFVFGNVFAQAFLGNASVGIIITLIVATVAPELRATATAVALTSVHLMGDVVSQPLVGKVSDVLQRSSPAATIWTVLQPLSVTSDQHLAVALVAVTIPGALVTAALFMRASRAAPV
jgi:MFS transporter, Spinster family, sphingosine-1-phosphate transporter